MAQNNNLTIQQGKTFQFVLRWETTPIIYKPISGITQAAPAALTVIGHGVPNGWRVAVTNVKGMTEINATANAVKDKDYHVATVGTVDTITLNDVNAMGFKAYQSGGVIQYNTPVDLTGFTASMTIKDKKGGTSKLALTTENSRIVINTTAHTVLLTIDAVTTAGFTWATGVYDLEMISATGVVTLLSYGSVTVEKEVTT